MKYEFEAKDLLERVLNHQDSLSQEELVDMVQSTMLMIVQDHINANVFKDTEPGNKKQELKALLRKAQELVEEVEGYCEASYLTSCDLERETDEQQYVAAKLNLIDCGAEARILLSKIAFIEKQLDLE